MEKALQGRGSLSTKKKENVIKEIKESYSEISQQTLNKLLSDVSKNNKFNWLK